MRLFTVKRFIVKKNESISGLFGNANLKDTISMRQVQKNPNIEIKNVKWVSDFNEYDIFFVRIYVFQVGYTNKIQDKHDSVWCTLVLPNRNWSSGKPMWSKMILAVFSGLQGSTIFLMHKIL